MVLVNLEKRIVRLRLPKKGVYIEIKPESESADIDDNLIKDLAPYIKAFGLQIKQSAEVTAPERLAQPRADDSNKDMPDTASLSETPDLPPLETVTTDGEPSTSVQTVAQSKRASRRSRRVK